MHAVCVQIFPAGMTSTQGMEFLSRVDQTVRKNHFPWRTTRCMAREDRGLSPWTFPPAHSILKTLRRQPMGRSDGYPPTAMFANLQFMIICAQKNGGRIFFWFFFFFFFFMGTSTLHRGNMSFSSFKKLEKTSYLSLGAQCPELQFVLWAFNIACRCGHYLKRIRFIRPAGRASRGECPNFRGSRARGRDRSTPKTSARCNSSAKGQLAD